MSPRGAADGDDDSQLFAGVRFALVGFDPVSESQYRSEIVRRGGADAGGRGADCTHVVVCDLVYDDPVCVAAREDGKQVVTELWVDDSLDLGVVADADRVLYRPVRDLNGILGSESLHICLTGYQKNGREDIMVSEKLEAGRALFKDLAADFEDRMCSIHKERVERCEEEIWELCVRAAADEQARALPHDA